MHANELRVGNYVLYNDRLVIVDEILFEGINLTHEGAEYKYRDLNPIPLTEEILLKCGYKKKGNYTFLCESSLMQLEISYINGLFLNSTLAIEIKYLHQLQNLYFALTGEELNVQL